MEKFEDIPKQELSWTEEPVIGLVLLNAHRDSNGSPIEPYVYYDVAKHIPTGKVIIFPTERNMKHEFINNYWNKTGKFN